MVLGLHQLRRSLSPYQQVQRILTGTLASDDAHPDTDLQQSAAQADITLHQQAAQARSALQQLQDLDHGS